MWSELLLLDAAAVTPVVAAGTTGVAALVFGTGNAQAEAATVLLVEDGALAEAAFAGQRPGRAR